jgi:hypothetical protein
MQVLPLFLAAHCIGPDSAHRSRERCFQVGQLLLAPVWQALLWPIMSVILLTPQRRAPDPDDAPPSMSVHSQHRSATCDRFRSRVVVVTACDPVGVLVCWRLRLFYLQVIRYDELQRAGRKQPHGHRAYRAQPWRHHGPQWRGVSD